MTKAHSVPPLPLRDFERVSQTIMGILNAENANLTASCLYFGFMGEAILNSHYKLGAKAVIGKAAFSLPSVGVIAFDAPGGSAVTANNIPFHCWVEAKGWVLDFSSIVFPLIAKAGNMRPCPYRMFQKPLVKAARSISELDAEASFYVAPDHLASEKIMTPFMSKQANPQLIQIACEWYKKGSFRVR